MMLRRMVSIRSVGENEDVILNLGFHSKLWFYTNTHTPADPHQTSKHSKYERDLCKLIRRLLRWKTCTRTIWKCEANSEKILHAIHGLLMTLDIRFCMTTARRAPLLWTGDTQSSTRSANRNSQNCGWEHRWFTPTLFRERELSPASSGNRVVKKLGQLRRQRKERKEEA